MRDDEQQQVELAGHLSFLAGAAEAGITVPAGRLYGLPELPGGGCWVDMAGAAALTKAAPKTITSWLARGGPVRNPFPMPRRFMYRLYWPRDEIDSWMRGEREAGR